MEKNILSEIDQMKYLFGYKPGKVISEQEQPKTNKILNCFYYYHKYCYFY